MCKYTAGSSDTNPIFLFSVASLEGSAPPVIVGELTSSGERDLQPEVETSLNLPDTHNTVSESVIRICEVLMSHITGGGEGGPGPGVCQGEPGAGQGV